MAFEFKQCQIPDVKILVPRRIQDPRGFFQEVYKESEFRLHGIDDVFVQDNHSRSSRGVLRGLHYQKHPAAQAKLVRVVTGEIYDVAVDLRRGSPHYGKWVGEVLSSANGKILYCPAGFAHGFMTLSETADVVYKVTSEYAPETEAGVSWNCPEIGIRWPDGQKLLSERDEKWPTLNEADHDFQHAFASRRSA